MTTETRPGKLGGSNFKTLSTYSFFSNMVNFVIMK